MFFKKWWNNNESFLDKNNHIYQTIKYFDSHLAYIIKNKSQKVSKIVS